MTDEIPAEAIAEAVSNGHARLPNGDLLMGMPLHAVMAERDPQAEQDHAEWRGWMEAQGYQFDDDSYQAEAFAAGMQAQRDLDAAAGPQTSPPGKATIRDWNGTEYVDKLVDAMPTGTPGLVVHRGEYGGFVLSHASSGLRAADFRSDIFDCAEALGELGDWTAMPDRELLAKAGQCIAAYDALPAGTNAPRTAQEAELARQGLPVIPTPRASALGQDS